MGLIAVTASITAQNTFTGVINLNGRPSNLSVSGTFVATVHLQRTFDDSTWLDVESYTSPIEKIIDDPETGVRYRLGVKTGNYTSGTVVCRISQ